MKTRFNADLAQQVIDWFPQRLTHTKGTWAGKPFILEPFQAGIVSDIFGHQVWSDEVQDWVRQYRTAYIEIPRKNGKSELGAAVALRLTFADQERGAEVYSVAKDVDQANIVFAVAKAMVEANQGLSERCKVFRRLIEVPKTGNIYRVIPGDDLGAHGYNPHGVIFDELHTQQTRDLWDVMTSAQGTRSQPLTMAFSTAGVDMDSICWEIHEYGDAIARGAHTDPSFYYKWWGFEHPDAWFDEKEWEQANPALGKFLFRTFLESEAVKAKHSPARQATFKRLYGNVWGQKESRFIDINAWDATAGIVDETELAGKPCYGGIDLASTTDIAALCWDFADYPSEGTHSAIWRFWIPEDKLFEFDKRTAGRAAVWVRQGYIKTTPGNTIDYKAIMATIDQDARKFQVRELAFDPWGMTQLSQDLTELGMKMVDFPQHATRLNGPTREWERLILEGKFIHGGNPVMRWMTDNVVIRVNPTGHIRIDKEKSVEKVDGPAATVMAVGRAVADETKPSIYETRGIVTV